MNFVDCVQKCELPEFVSQNTHLSQCKLPLLLTAG